LIALLKDVLLEIMLCSDSVLHHSFDHLIMFNQLEGIRICPAPGREFFFAMLAEDCTRLVLLY
jgi:hypothetical protein